MKNKSLVQNLIRWARVIGILFFLLNLRGWGSVYSASETGRTEKLSVAPFLAPADCSSSIASSFNNNALGASATIWFNSVLKTSGAGSKPVKITFDNSSLQFSANGTNYNLSVPNAVVTFSPSATSANSQFRATTNTWETTVPSNIIGDVFLSGLAFPVTNSLPGGINPVTWTGRFTSDTPGVSVQWQWSAAVYSNFTTIYTALGVKPVDDAQASSYKNADRAGTPENRKAFVLSGAGGSGGTDYTGASGQIASVTACSSLSADLTVASTPTIIPSGPISKSVATSTPVLGCITGIKADEHGVHLPGWTINLDWKDESGVAQHLSAVTDKNGWYGFYNLKNGLTYNVSEMMQPGWEPIFPTSYVIVLNGCPDPIFKNRFVGTLSPTPTKTPQSAPTKTPVLGCVTGIKADEHGVHLPGWTINLDWTDEKGIAHHLSTVTDKNGWFGFLNLQLGLTYVVSEVMQPGWEPIFPTSFTIVLTGCPDPIFKNKLITPTPTPTNTSTNTPTPTNTPALVPPLGCISGTKQDNLGVFLPGWTINLDWVEGGAAKHLTTTTDGAGSFKFTGLLSGLSYQVSEVLQTGWKNILPLSWTLVVTQSDKNFAQCQNALFLNQPPGTPTPTSSNTPTKTPPAAPTNTPTLTSTNTLTRTPPAAPTNTPTLTATNTPSNTPTNTATNTLTLTPTKTQTNTPTPTKTIALAPTPTQTRIAPATGLVCTIVTKVESKLPSATPEPLVGFFDGPRSSSSQSKLSGWKITASYVHPTRGAESITKLTGADGVGTAEFDITDLPEGSFIAVALTEENQTGWTPVSQNPQVVSLGPAGQTKSCLAVTFANQRTTPPPTNLVHPKGMVSDTTRNHLFVASSHSNSVVVFDENTMTAIAQIPVGIRPWGIGLVNDKVFVGNIDSNSVSVINAATTPPSKITDIDLTGKCDGQPANLAINPITKRVYVAIYGEFRGGDHVAVIDGSTNTFIGCLNTNKRTFGVAVNPTLNQLYVSNFDGMDLQVFNISSVPGTLIQDLTLGGRPFTVQANPSTNEVYIMVAFDFPNYGTVNNLEVFTASLSGLTFSTANVIGNNLDGGYIWVSQTNGSLYIAEPADNQVQILDPTTFAVCGVVPLTDPFGLAGNQKLGRIYVGLRSADSLATIPDNICGGAPPPSP